MCTLVLRKIATEGGGMAFETEADAREFGLHKKQGGWRMGLLVARNVERGEGGPRTGSFDPVSKVSAREFAEKAGLSGHKQVIRYLDRWDEYADDGLVPPSTELSPGDEIEIPEEKFRLNSGLGGGKNKDGNIHQQMMEHVYAILKLKPKWTPEQADEVKPGKSEKDLRALRDVNRFFVEDVDPAVAKKGTPLRAVGG
jgi:hypothetical protein